MGLGIAMLISYLPFAWWVVIEMREQWVRDHSSHPPIPRVYHLGEPHNTDGNS